MFQKAKMSMRNHLSNSSYALQKDDWAHASSSTRTVYDSIEVLKREQNASICIKIRLCHLALLSSITRTPPRS